MVDCRVLLVNIVLCTVGVRSFQVTDFCQADLSKAALEGLKPSGVRIID